MNRTRTIAAIALTAASLTFSKGVAAQSFLMPSTPVRGVWTEASYSDFKGAEVSFPTAVWYLSGRLPVTRRLSVVADLPFSHARMDLSDAGDEHTSSVLGNPYLGAELSALDGLVVEVGVRAPLTTADEESFADMVAFVADPLRGEAFLEEMIPLTGAVTYAQGLPRGFGVRARTGITALFQTGEEATSTDAALDYGLVGSYTRGAGRMGLGFSGRWYATSDEGSFAETSLHYAALTADVGVAGVRPGVSVRVPVDEAYREILSSTIGFYLQVPLR